MILETISGTRYDFLDYNIHRLFHRIPSMGVDYSTSYADGRDKPIYSDPRYVRGNIVVDFVYLVDDIYHYYMIRDVISNLFSRKEGFYVIFRREPFKRWFVRLASTISTEPNPKGEPFTIELIPCGLFAESVGSSLDLEKREFDVGKWGFGMHVDTDTYYKYTHYMNNFDIYNIGDESIIPEEDSLVIKIKGTSISTFELLNETTNELFVFYGNLTNNDELIIDGVRFIKNGISVLRDTNAQLISLKTGKNKFRVVNGNVKSISFDFKFKYK